LALRFNAPIFYKNIFWTRRESVKTNNQDSDKDSQEIDDILSNPETFGHQDDSKSDRIYLKHSLQELSLLKQAVAQEL
jgi:hypothetical protein